MTSVTRNRYDFDCLYRRSFSSADQEEFAQISGDYNLIHVDPIAARRLLSASLVVHGVHSVLWAIDCFLKSQSDPVSIIELKASFPKTIEVGEEVILEIGRSKNNIELLIKKQNTVKARVELTIKNQDIMVDNACYFNNSIPQVRQPAEITAEQVTGHEGKLVCHLDLEIVKNLFPECSKKLCLAQLSTIVTCSRLVGVECPGKNSLFSELHLTGNFQAQTKTLTYRVNRFIEGFNLLYIDLKSASMQGEIKAFIRPKPVQQASILEIKKSILENEFAEQRAIIIGGSRGLGEVTAKILASGGAKVVITYCHGLNDARRVADEINRHGGDASYCHYDVIEGKSSNNLLKGSKYTHFYYFATPKIFSGTREVFSKELFFNFCEYYLFGFLNCLEQFKKLGIKKVFNPSSLAIEEIVPDLSEYAAAKAAVETCFEFLNRSNQNVTIYSPRLPRLATDQTVTLTPVINNDPIPLLLKELRVMRGR